MSPRSPLRPAGWLFALVLTLATVFAPQRARADASLDALRARLERDSAAAVARIDRGQPDSALALSQVTGAALATAADPAFAARAALLHPGMLIRLARAKEALPEVLEAQRMAATSGDTTVWMCSMRLEAMVRNYLGDYTRAEALAHRWDALAHTSGNTEYQGFAATMFGWFAWQRADLVTSRRELERGLALFERVPSSIGLPYTLSVLANVVSAQGDYARARVLYARQLALGTASGNQAVRIMALENLARVESRVGDPTIALAQWREALALRRSRHETGAWLVTADNVVEELLALGRTDEAGTLAEEAVATAERESLGMELAWQRSMLGDASWAAGRHARAKAMWRAALGSSRTEDAQPRAGAAAGLIEALIEEDSTAAALALANAETPAPGAGMEQEALARLVTLRARLLTDTGHPAEAAGLARRIALETGTSGDLEWSLAAWTQVVRAERRAGRADSAAAAIVRATDVWERSRAHLSDPEYREVRGEQAHVLMTEAIGAALARPGGGAAAAFAILQRFKTRTLLEHLVAPAALAAAAPPGQDVPLTSLAAFQHRTLAPDELFIEFAAGSDTTYVFAITRDTCRVLRAPGTRALAPVLAALTAASEPGRGGAGSAFALAGTELGRALLDGLADLLRGHPALIVAADGPLHRSPFAAWVAPGEAAPLFAGHRLTLSPSASVLALLRARREPPAGRLLAMAGAPERGEAPLAGARREVRGLGERFRGVDTWFAAAGRGAPPTLERMATYGALHFAGHTHVDEQMPWRSGLLVGAESRGGDSLVTAERIAGARLGARLVVLSSCQSGGGRARGGEGVAGLATAFLAAGSHAVIASLWVVDDRATERLMRRFYAGLAHGLTADLALRYAQAAMRADASTADPFYWAGFELVGDGRTTLPLARRLVPAGPATTALVLLLVAAVLLGLARWRSGRAG